MAMKLYRAAELDCSRVYSAAIFTVTWLCSCALTYSWLHRHIAFKFPLQFMGLTFVVGLALLFLMLRVRLWIPVKVAISMCLAASIAYLLLMVVYDVQVWITQSGHTEYLMTLEDILVLPVLFFLILKLYITLGIALLMYFFLSRKLSTRAGDIGQQA